MMKVIRINTTKTIVWVLLCLTTTASVFAANTPKTEPVKRAGFHKGVTLGAAHWRKDEYKNLEWTLDKATEYGASHVIVIPNGFLYPSKAGNEIKKVYFDDPLYASDPRFQTRQWGWWGASLTDAQIREIAKGIRKRGMKLVLKPHIDPWDGTSRGAAAPSDPETFFRNYTTFITHYASLAEELNAPLFIIGTELDDIASTRGKLAKRGIDVTSEWRKIIRSIRKVYKGKLTYSSSAIGDWKTWNPKDIAKGPSYIAFWDDLDYIGFEPYFGVTRKNDPSPEELTQGFKEKFDLYAHPLAQKYGKKILLTEVNGYAFDSMNTDPIAMFTKPEEHPVDHQEQANYYNALLQTIVKLDYVDGSYIWSFFNKTASPKNDEAYFEIQKKSHRDSLLGVPAGNVLKEWYNTIDNSDSRDR